MSGLKVAYCNGAKNVREGCRDDSPMNPEVKVHVIGDVQIVACARGVRHRVDGALSCAYDNAAHEVCPYDTGLTTMRLDEESRLKCEKSLNDIMRLVSIEAYNVAVMAARDEREKRLLQEQLLNTFKVELYGGDYALPPKAIESQFGDKNAKLEGFVLIVQQPIDALKRLRDMEMGSPAEDGNDLLAMTDEDGKLNRDAKTRITLRVPSFSMFSDQLTTDGGRGTTHQIIFLLRRYE